MTAARPIGLTTKLLYGFGSVASAVKQRGLSTFLLIFYNQVIGLPAALVGLVINLISDLAYMWIDPRIDFEAREV